MLRNVKRSVLDGFALGWTHFRLFSVKFACTSKVFLKGEIYFHRLKWTLLLMSEAKAGFALIRNARPFRKNSRTEIGWRKMNRIQL
jgi:hypothetical protein